MHAGWEELLEQERKHGHRNGDMDVVSSEIARQPTIFHLPHSLPGMDADGDLEIFESAPSSTRKGGPKRGGNYTHNEDIQLCYSWMDISNDPITGNEQPLKAYWTRIVEDFHAKKTFNSYKTVSSLEHRWGIIQKDFMKFQGCYEEVERCRQSGIPFKEHIAEAQAIFAKDDSKKKSCQFVHCWLKLRHCKKFASLQMEQH